MLLDLEPHKPSGLFEYVRLQHDIADLFGTAVDVVERKALKNLVRERALIDAIDAF